MKYSKFISVFLFLVIFCSPYVYAQKAEEIKCFEVLKNISSIYGIEIPLKDYNKFKEKAILYFTRLNIPRFGNVTSILIYPFGNNTTFKKIYNVSIPYLKENNIMFFYYNENFKGCGILQIKKGSREDSKKEYRKLISKQKLVSQEFLRKNNFNQRVIVSASTNHYKNLIILKYKNFISKPKKEKEGKNRNIIFPFLPFLIVLIVIVFLLLVYLYIRKKKQLQSFS